MIMELNGMCAKIRPRICLLGLDARKFSCMKISMFIVFFFARFQMNFQYGMTYDSRTRYLVEHLRKASSGKVRLLLNHMGILQRYYNEYDTVG